MEEQPIPDEIQNATATLEQQYAKLEQEHKRWSQRVITEFSSANGKDKKRIILTRLGAGSILYTARCVQLQLQCMKNPPSDETIAGIINKLVPWASENDFKTLEPEEESWQRIGDAMTQYNFIHEYATCPSKALKQLYKHQLAQLKEAHPSLAPDLNTPQ